MNQGIPDTTNPGLHLREPGSWTLYDPKIQTANDFTLTAPLVDNDVVAYDSTAAKFTNKPMTDFDNNYLRLDATNRMAATLNVGRPNGDPGNIENANNISSALGASLDLTADCMLESSSGAVIINSNLPVSIPNSFLDMNDNIIENVGEPFDDTDAANKKYVDD
ncbi:MAG: hypothetical protein IPQ08_05940 [Chitinophagaceae bacterium]|nr:hypothetical protein [Chitinophagaceae bacterium]